MKPINYIGFNLQDGAYRTNDLGELLNSPIRNIISEELARSDNAVAVFRKYQSRSYGIGGTIHADTSDALESAIDALKLAFLSQRGPLAVGWAGGYRYFESECQNVNISRGPTDLTRAAWSAQFYMERAFATDGTTATMATDSAVTGGSEQLGAANIGTYLAMPYITLELTAIDPNISDVAITIGNPASGEYLTITDTFEDGDTIVIDTVNRQVFHNSELINPVGNFPAWAPGNGLLDYSDTASSRTIEITASYEPRYL